MRQNHRTARGRTGRSPADELRREGQIAAEVWARWREEERHRSRGWPSESTEGRAMAQAQSGTRLDGIARWRGTGTPPRVPRETRQPAKTRIPAIDRSRLGPAADRLLQDLEATRKWRASLAVKLAALTAAPACERAAALGVCVGTYRRDVRDGLLFLGYWLRAERLR